MYEKTCMNRLISLVFSMRPLYTANQKRLDHRHQLCDNDSQKPALPCM